MTLPHEVTEENINSLDMKQLTELALRLLSLEAGSNGIPRSCVKGTLNITLHDGGEDARIAWDGPPLSTEWIPDRDVLFQCKAVKMVSDFNKSLVQAEVLKPRVDEVLSLNGTYLIFCSTMLSEEIKDERITNMRESLKNANKSYADTCKISIFAAGDIRRWANCYLPAVMQILTNLGKTAPSRMIPWELWAGYRADEFLFVNDHELDKKIKQLREHFQGTQKTARLFGLSGVGKTRLAFEVFRPPNSNETPEDYIQIELSKSCVYVHNGDDPALLCLVDEMARSGIRGTIVVDNCRWETHKELTYSIRHSNSNLNLLSIDYDTEKKTVDASEIYVERLSDEAIKNILRQRYPGFTDADILRISDFAQGFPGMAVEIAKAQLANEPSIARLNDSEIVKKILWQRNDFNEEADKVIHACSIFKHLGFFEEVEQQRVFVAEKICRIRSCDFFRYSQTFIDRHVLEKRNRYVRVVPFPLAIRLAEEWWKGCEPLFAKQVFIEGEMPEEMQIALCEQLAHLDFLSNAKEVIISLCGEEAFFGNAEVLLSKQGSRLFSSIVEVNPVVCVETLERVLNKIPLTTLREMKEPRRNLVRSLEKLCFWEFTFHKAARLMLLLAATENEAWANNATNLFLQLYHVLLSGTTVKPTERLSILEEALASGVPEKQEMAIRALGKGLTTMHFSRQIGSELQGSGPAREDWKPISPDDIQDIHSFFDFCIATLTRISCENKTPLSETAESILGNEIRGLVLAGRIDAIDRAIRTIGVKNKGFWPEANHSLMDIERFDSERLPQETKDLLIVWKDILTPKQLSDLLKQTVSLPSYDMKEQPGGGFQDLSAERAKKLAKEVSLHPNDLLDSLPILLIGEQRLGFFFGRELALDISNPTLFIEKALRALSELPSGKGNPAILSGFFSALTDRELIRVSLIRVLGEPILRPYAIELFRFTQPDPPLLSLFLQALHEGVLPVNDFRAFAFNSVLAELPLLEVETFCNNIASHGISGVYVALEILYMHCFHNSNLMDSAIGTFSGYISNCGLLFEIISSKKGMDMHLWASVVLRLLKDSEKGESTGQKIISEILSVFLTNNISIISYPDISSLLKVLLKDYFTLCWDKIGPLLLSEDRDIASRIAHLLRDAGVGHHNVDILSVVPLDSLLKWCEENRPDAPRIIARIISVTIQKEDKSLTWHPFILPFLDSFGEDIEFLHCLNSNLHSFSFWGSCIPYYKQLSLLLNGLKTHRYIQVRNWADMHTQWIEKEIEKESRIEEERDFGIYS